MVGLIIFHLCVATFETLKSPGPKLLNYHTAPRGAMVHDAFPPFPPTKLLNYSLVTTHELKEIREISSDSIAVILYTCDLMG